MMGGYENFMIFELDDSGDRVRLNVSEAEFRENNGSNVLHSEQVIVIVKEDLRRIYIWKGATSPVRKRFISSRVASGLQEELVKEAAFHRCKIVSVDQGDEVDDFLKAFHFESMQVEEKLADMRYIRNVERERMLDQGIIPDESIKFVKVEKKPDQATTVRKTAPKAKASPARVSSGPKQPYSPPARASRAYQPSFSQSEALENKIKEKILKTDVPENYKRQNLITGYSLYGAVTKKVNVLGKNIEEIGWEKVSNLPKDTIEMDAQKLRVYFDSEKGIVEAIEILQLEEGKSAAKKGGSSKSSKTATKQKKSEEDINFKSLTVKELKSYCETHNIEIASNARKADIIKIIKQSSSKNNPSKRRALPKIPSNDD